MKTKFHLNLIVTVMTVLFCFPAVAQYRTAPEAARLAQQFFGQCPSVKSAASELQLVWDGEDVATKSTLPPAFYVFNRGDAEGFVMISGNKQGVPVLAYAWEGSFVADRMPENLRVWMHAFKEQSRRVSAQPLRSGETASDFRMSGEKDLGTPDYNQDDPYNSKCPYLAEGWRAYTGCVITATAIVMGYHRWPEKGTGIIPLYMVNGQQLGPYNLDEAAPYDWDSMESISTVMVQLGAMARAAYGYTGTSARLERMMVELPRYMKYNPKVHFEERDKCGKEEWARMLRAEIDAGRPVPYEGYDEVSGHAFVIDGYNDQGFFGVNWGWGGYCNGYYDLEYLTPAGSGIGGNASGGYSLAQGGIFEVRPREEADVSIDVVEYLKTQSYADGLTVAGMELPVKQGDSFRVDAGIIKNYGTNTIHGDFKLVVTDDEGRLIEELYSAPSLPLEPFDTQLVVDRQMVTVTKEVKPGYRLRIVFQSEFSGQWIPVTCKPDLGQWEILLNDAEPAISLEDATSFRYERKTGQITVTTLPDASVTLKSSAGKDCSSVLRQEGPVWTFLRSNLASGTYMLTLSRGVENKILELQF